MTGRVISEPTSSSTAASGSPRRQLGVWHAVAVCVGTVIGAGIFRSTPDAAMNAGSETELLLLWVLGGLVSIVGGLCFAELSAAFPDPGGDYYFLRRAYGERLGFLFAWSRFAVIHTGSMAMLAFVFSDYVNELFSLGHYGRSALAAGLVVLLASINLIGIRFGARTQVGLMTLVLAGLLSVGIAGIWLASQGIAPPPPAPPDPNDTQIMPASLMGAALIYVFLAYGGWSDAATLSAEMRDARRGIQRALIIGITLVMALYLLVNWAFLTGLGHLGLARSSAPAADLMRHAFGQVGELWIVSVVALTSISVLNAVLIAASRTTYAAARDIGGFQRLADWHEGRGTPSAAILATAGVALLLVAFGTITRGGFSTIVDYMTPVYWLFLCLSGIAVIVLRYRAPDVARPFKVPLFPFLPLVFVASSLYVLYSSLMYVCVGAITGLAVLTAGWLLLLALRASRARRAAQGMANR